MGHLAWLYGASKRRGPFLAVSPLSTIPNWRRHPAGTAPLASRASARGLEMAAIERANVLLQVEGWTEMNGVVYHGPAA